MLTDSCYTYKTARGNFWQIVTRGAKFQVAYNGAVFSTCEYMSIVGAHCAICAAMGRGVK